MSQNNLSGHTIIKGVKTSGQPFEYLLNKEFTSINIIKQDLRSIDLSPLANCPNLGNLSLARNKLERVDLSPLANCHKLKELNLRHNSIKSIDLSPLENKKEFSSLILFSNKLTSVDLTPLQFCDKLEYLSVVKNELTSLDLTPLQFCDKLENLSIAKNKLTSLDLTPISSLTNLRMLSLQKNEFTELDFTPVQHIIPKLTMFNVDKSIDTQGLVIEKADGTTEKVVEPLMTEKEKTNGILLIITFFTSVFGFLIALYYLIKKQKAHALIFLLAGIFAALAAVFFATVTFTTSIYGIVGEILIGIITWIGGFGWLWVRLSDADYELQRDKERELERQQRKETG